MFLFTILNTKWEFLRIISQLNKTEILLYLIYIKYQNLNLTINLYKKDDVYNF
jgi:hypothetical protein